MKKLAFLFIILFFYEVQAQPEGEGKTKQVQPQNQPVTALETEKAETPASSNQAQATNTATPIKATPIKVVTPVPAGKASTKVTAPVKAANTESTNKPSATVATPAGPVTTPVSTPPVPSANTQVQQVKQVNANQPTPVVQSQPSGESDLQTAVKQIEASMFSEEWFSKWREKSRWSLQTGLSHYFSKTSSLTQIPLQIETNWGLSDDIKWVIQGEGGVIDSEFSEIILFTGLQTGIKVKIRQDKDIFRFVSLTGGLLYPFLDTRAKLAWSGNLSLETVYYRKETMPLNSRFGLSLLYYDDELYLGIAFHMGSSLFNTWRKKSGYKVKK